MMSRNITINIDNLEVEDHVYDTGDTVNVTDATFAAMADAINKGWVTDDGSGPSDSGAPDASDTTKGLVELATVPEAVAGTDSTRAVTPQGLAAGLAALIASAPGSLDTLNELAAALGDDANFAATMATLIGTKVPMARTLAALDLSADRSASDLRTALGLGSAALQAASAFATASGLSTEASDRAAADTTLTTTKASDLVDATVAGASAQLAAGVTSNVAANGAYTSPALGGSVGTPPLRWAIKAAASAGCTITYPDTTGVSTTVTLVAGEVLTFRQKTTLGWGAESGNKPLGQLDRRFAPAYSNAIKGIPVSDNCLGHADGTARTTSATYRSPHTIAVACTDLRFVWHAWLNNGTANSPNYADADSSAAVVIKASVEVAGTIYRLTFNGSQTATIDGGGFIQSDPLPLEIAAGTVLYVRTFVSSGTWHYTHYSLVAGGAGGTGGANTDLTAPGSSAIADSTFSAMFAPAAITGRPLDTSVVASVLIVGDSIAAGYGDAPGTTPYQGRNVTNPQLHGGGFIARALFGHYGHISIGVTGESGANFITNTGHFRRLAFAGNATTFICEYGRNDISGGSSLATVQATLISAWQLGSRRGMRVIQTTVTPKTTSTDGWRTTTNQTTANAGQETVRTGLNDWLRDGAPVTSSSVLTPIAVGATGLRMSQTGHPLFGIWDVADAAESARNSGLWKAWANTRTITDAAINSGGNSLNSATQAVFTDTDLGRLVYIAGAGAAGAAYYDMIQKRNSATQVNPVANAGSTVSAATAIIGDGNTLDGTHPAPYIATLMAAACDLSMIA
jgi:hypothetical protein